MTRETTTGAGRGRLDWRAALAIGLAVGAVGGFFGGRSTVTRDVPASPAVPPEQAPAADPAPATRAPAPARPVAPPPEPAAPAKDLHTLQTPAKLRERFEQALKQAGAVGEVIRVDCSELPCVTFGGVDQRYDPQALLTTAALGGGVAPKRILFRWETEPNAPYRWHLFAVAWLPPDLSAEARPAWRQSVTRRYRAARIEGLTVGSPRE